MMSSFFPHFHNTQRILPVNVILPECVAWNVKFATSEALNDHLVLFGQAHIVVYAALDALAQVILWVIIFQIE
jgi:hypothetical protein